MKSELVLGILALIVGLPILLSRLLIIDAAALHYIPPAIIIFFGIVLFLNYFKKSDSGKKHKE